MSKISKLEQNLIIKKIDDETANISINDNEMLMAIVGQFDQNLKNLSKLSNTKVYFRGNSITCKGNKENLNIFCDAIKFLINKYFLTNIIEKEDIVLSVKENLEEETKSNEENLDTLSKDLIQRREKLEILMKESSEQKAKLDNDRESRGC